MSTRHTVSGKHSFTITPFLSTDRRERVIAAWTSAFAAPPNGPRNPHDLEDQLARHMNCRGFQAFVASDNASSAILGFIYGYTNVAGEWWRDRVALALSAQQTTQVLDHSYCLSELGVVPEARRRGVAALLVQRLILAQSHPYVLLSTKSDNYEGLAFYRSTGWSTLVPRMSFGWNFPPYDILLRSRADVGRTVILPGP